MQDSSRAVRHRVAVNMASKYGATAIRTVVRILLAPFLIGSLGRAAYGLMALSGQALQFLSLINAAFSLSYMRFATAHHARGDYEKMNVVLSKGFALSVISGAIFALATAGVAYFSEALFDLPHHLVAPARLVIAITGFSGALNIVTGVWGSAIFVSQRFYIQSITSVIANLSAAAAIVFAFHVRTPSVVVWALILIGTRVGARFLFLIPMASKALPQFRLSLQAMRAHFPVREMVAFSGLCLLGNLGDLLCYATDSILIVNLNELEAGQVTDYNVAQRWMPVIGTLIVSFAQTLTPVMTADFSSGNTSRLRETLKRGIRYSMIMGIFPCLSLIILARPFLFAWLGPTFVASSAAVMQVIMLGLLLTIPGIVGYQALVACGRIGPAVAASLAGGVANIVLSVLLVKVFGLGLMGIAAGSVTCIVAVNALYIPYLACRCTGVPPADLLGLDHLRAWLGAAPFVGVACLISATWTPANLLVAALQLGLCAVVYAGGVWSLSLTAGDRDSLRGTIRGVLGRNRPSQDD